MPDTEPDAWIDRHGDVWRLGPDGLMHTPETRPFPREYVEKKWGPLRVTVENDGRPVMDHDHEKCCPYLRCAHPACCGYYGQPRPAPPATDQGASNV